MIEIRVKWDKESNSDDPGWVYEESPGIWQPVPGPTGRDRDALPDEIAGEIGFGIDVVFSDNEQRRRGWK